MKGCDNTALSIRNQSLYGRYSYIQAWEGNDQVSEFGWVRGRDEHDERVALKKLRAQTVLSKVLRHIICTLQES